MERGTILGPTLPPLGEVPRPLGGIEWTLVYEIFFYALVALLWTARSNRILGGFCAWAVAITSARRRGERRSRRRFRGSRCPPTTARSSGSSRSTDRHLDLTDARTLLVLVPALVIGGEFFAQTEWRLMSVSLGAACLVAGLARTALMRGASRDGIVTQWGDGSYGLYLVHSAVIALVFPSLIGVRQVHWLVGILGLFAIGMGAGPLYGMLEHRLYDFLKTRFRHAPWLRGAAATPEPARNQ